MKKGLIILADGFEDVEALSTIDILRRSSIVIDTVSLYDKVVMTQSKNKIIVDYLLEDIDTINYDFLIIPGGKAVFNVLDNNKQIDELIEKFYNEKKLICAICAAPRLIVKKGYLNNKKFTIFPNCLDDDGGGIQVDQGVVVEENIITAKAMYYSIDFALAIIEKLQGIEQMIKISNQIQGK